VKALTDAGIIPGIKVDIGAKEMAGHPERKSPKDSMDCRERLANIFKWARVLPNGAR